MNTRNPDPTSSAALSITRIANACTLIELDGRSVLTDPWLTERWYLRRGEPLGMAVDDLPALAAIVATNFAPNHWDLRALRRYRHKATTPVYVATASMARQARALGSRLAERLPWGAVRNPGAGPRIEAVPAGRMLRWRHNAYVISAQGIRVYFGGEIREVDLLRDYRVANPPVDVALLPTNGLGPAIGTPFVMGHKEAVDGATVLGARALIAIHDAHAADPMSLIFRRHGSAGQAKALAAERARDLDVVLLPPGQRWTYPRAGDTPSCG